MPTDITSQDIQNLLRVAGITSYTGQYRSLGGGEGNSTFVLDCGEAELVLRVAKYSQKNNLANEARALGLLDLGQVPKLIYFNESQLIHDRAWIIESHMSGERVEHLNAAQFKSLGALLANVHAVQSDESARVDFWEEFLHTSQNFGDERLFLNHPDSTLKQIINKAKDYFQSQSLYAAKPSLIHSDVSLENMLAGGDTISLIDWEFSRFTDPMADFSTLFYEDMEYNKGRWRIHITEQEKIALFSGYTEAGGTVDEARLKSWHNFDKLGAAVYLYWKMNHSGHTITPAQSAQYAEDLNKLVASLGRNL